MGDLTIVRASAGSGKTHDLCEDLARRVVDRLDPARVLATTYTRKAAVELKGRIQAALLKAERLEPAARLGLLDRLDLAAVGTVHSVGLDVLARCAISLGISPRIEVLEEEASRRAICDVISRVEPTPWALLAEAAQRFSIDDPQDLVLALLQAKRANRLSDEVFRAQIEASGERLIELMSSPGPLEKPLTFEALQDRVRDALRDLGTLTQDATAKTKEACRKLRVLAAGRARSWQDFVAAAKVEAGKRSGADDRLAELRGLALQVLRCPDLHDGLRDFLEQLTHQTLALDAAYREFKQARGLVDFTDLEVRFLDALNAQNLDAALRAEFEFVAVDEFQDTNPLQLALFQRLRALAGGNRWVGDAKQAIYGFRGADAELVTAVWKRTLPAKRGRLTHNWRSQRGLVQLVGRLFKPVFGDEVVLEPKKPAVERGIERWIIEADKAQGEAQVLAAGIGQLRDDGIRLKDIAVLARTNEGAQRIGAACRDRGLPVVMELAGLFDTREGALTLAGLRLVADRRDAIAAATVLHLLTDPEEVTPSWIVERLQALRAGADGESEEAGARLPWAGDARFAPLEGIDYRASSPSVVVGQVIDALAVGDRLRSWGDAAQRSANLDALVDLALGYENEMRELGAAATLTGFIAFAEDAAGGGKDATATPYGIDAVTILTYHRSKGLEWPVVMLTSLDYGHTPDLWAPFVGGGGTDPDDPLGGRTLRFWPWPFGRDPYRRLKTGSGLEDIALQSNEGMAAVKSEREEAARLLYVGFTRARDKLVLAHRERACVWLSQVPGIDAILRPDLSPGEHKLKGIDTTYVLRKLKETGESQSSGRMPKRQRWLAPLRAAASAAVAQPRYHRASASPPVSPRGAPTLESLGGRPPFPKFENRAQEGLVGDAVHAYFASLPSLAGADGSGRKAVAERCLRSWGAEKVIAVGDLVTMGERFGKWITARYPQAAWHTEVPVTSPRAEGGQWNGVIDLLLELPAHAFILIDHKTAPLRRDQLEAKAMEFTGQLAAYREMLEAQRLKVEALWIHFPLAGAVLSL